MFLIVFYHILHFSGRYFGYKKTYLTQIFIFLDLTCYNFSQMLNAYFEINMYSFKFRTVFAGKNCYVNIGDFWTFTSLRNSDSIYFQQTEGVYIFSRINFILVSKLNDFISKIVKSGIY